MNQSGATARTIFDSTITLTALTKNGPGDIDLNKGVLRAIGGPAVSNDSDV